MKQRTRSWFVGVSMVLFGALGQAGGLLVPTASAGVVEVQTYGASYGEFSARWWQWVLSIPAADNPNLDPDGTNCAQGQVDDVWFLAGAFGGEVTRTCIIPEGKPIFFPLINAVAFKPLGNETLLDLRGQAAGFIDQATGLIAEITYNGNTYDLSYTRVRSPSFTVIAPARGVLPPGQLKVPGNTDSLVSDGYWVLLEPLAAGDYQIVFGGMVGDFEVDVTYNITVE